MISVNEKSETLPYPSFKNISAFDQMSPTLTCALSFIERGWSLIPVYGITTEGTCACGNLKCSSPGKHPRTKNGVKDATLDESTIRRFCQVAYTNIGIVTGRASGICVVDIDAKNGGDESLKKLELEYGALPKTITALTGHTNGEHRYFKYPANGIGCRTNLLPGIDVRGDGGFVVAPPSRHLSGRYYIWEASGHPDEVALNNLPEWFLKLEKVETRKMIPRNSLGDSTIETGSRNATLFKIACSWRGEGHDYAAIEELLLIENKFRCQPPLTDSEVKNVAKSAVRYERGSIHVGETKIDWTIHQPLPPQEVDVPELNESLIPEPLRAWVFDVVNRMQSSTEMLMAPVIVILSGLIGRRLAIKPKQKDDWKVVPNLWGGIIAPPSAMKTPVMSEALRPVRRLEAQDKDKYFQELKIYNDKCKADKNYAGPEPIRRRRMTNDSTIEKLGEILNQNPNGMIVFRDELYGFLMNLEKSGRESDRQFYLESFNGDGTFTSDRIGRGTIDVEALCTSILGGIQPDRISSYFSETVKNGSGDDGFLSRFQVLVYPPRRKEWELIDRYPNKEARERAFAVFNRIDCIDFLGHGFEISQFEDIPHTRFNAEAQDYFYKWLLELETRLRSGVIESPAFEAHLTKYKKLMPSLALIFHVVDFCDPQNVDPKSNLVSGKATKMAVEWCEFLEAHAVKIYSDALRPQVTVAHALAKKIEGGDLTDGMTVRALYRKEWSQLRDSKKVRQGLSLLEELHWIRVVEESPTGKGAPSEVIKLNPSLKKSAS